MCVAVSGCADTSVRVPTRIERRTDPAAPFVEVGVEHYRDAVATRFEMRVAPIAPADGLSILVMPFPGLVSVRIGGVDIDARGHWPVYPLARDSGPAVVTCDAWYPVRPNFIAIGPTDALTRSLLRFELTAFAPGAALVLLGLIVLAASLGRRWGGAPPWLGAFATALGLVVLADCAALATLAGMTRDDVLLVHGAGLFAAVASLPWFLDATFPGPRPALARVAGATAALGLVAVGLAVAHVVPMRSTRLAAYAAFVVVVVIAARRLVPLARAGDRRARLLATGAAALAVMSVPGIISGAGVLSLLAVQPIAAWGAVVFVGFLAKIVEVELGDRTDRLAETTTSLAARVSELRSSHAAVDELNVELRLQVRDRSRELGWALAQLPRLAASDGAVAGDVVGGRYRVLRSLGAGGMGSVYEVERTDTGRRFALKRMRGAASGREAARFTREAEIAAQVKHPRLVPVVDVGLDESGRPYLVMEVVDGPSLSAFRGTRFGDASWALPILRDVAEGLEALHASGVVHRDLKPENVLLSAATGEARIADFGISRATGAYAEAEAPTEVRLDPALLAAAATLASSPMAAAGVSPGALTEPGSIVGTMLYLAPESARGAAPTAMLDVFAFGVMAFEMLAGEYPFDGYPFVIALEGRVGTPRNASLDAVPSAVVDVMLRALDFDPALRPTMTEVARTLAETVPAR